MNVRKAHAKGGQGGQQEGQGFGAPPPPPPMQPTTPLPPLDQIFDEKQKQPTNQLWVGSAGSAPLTATEAELRAVFAPFCPAVSIRVKSTFSFVGMATREQAAMARHVLQGYAVAGVNLKINFGRQF